MLAIVSTAVLLAGSANFCNAMKLTPVQLSTEKIDLVNEARVVSIALQDAVIKAQHDKSFVIDAGITLDSKEFQLLYSLIGQWLKIEVKLRKALNPRQKDKVKVNSVQLLSANCRFLKQIIFSGRLG